MDDSMLIARITARDRRALHTFYTTYAPILTRHIQARIANRKDVEEVLQDTLYAFLEAARDYTGKSSIRTFVTAIANHKIIDFYRRKKMRHIVFSRAPMIEHILSPLVSPEDAIDASILHTKIHLVLSTILPQYRNVLLLKYLENQSVAQIAKKLTVTAKSVESMLFRAKKAFVKAFVSI